VHCIASYFGDTPKAKVAKVAESSGFIWIRKGEKNSEGEQSVRIGSMTLSNGVPL